MATWSGDRERFDSKFTEVASVEEKRNAVLAANQHGWNALHFAAVYDRRAEMKEMLEVCPDLAATPNLQGWRPLHYAAGFGQTEIIDLLLLHGARLDCTNDIAAEYKGYTPLHRAFRWWLDPNKPNAISHLLTIGADPTLTDARGNTPVDLTADSTCGPAIARLAEAHAAGNAAADLERQNPETRRRLREFAAAAAN